MDFSNRKDILAEQDSIEEHENEDKDNDIQAYPQDFKVCLTCNRGLNEDERIINARFVNDALEAGKDISMFPICIKCNFE